MTAEVKVLCFAGSNRTGSWNGKLAIAAANAIRSAGGQATLISLRDYPMPLYDGDLEARDGVPATARALKSLMAQHHAVFIASPEYNASVTPLLKNTLDWLSRVKDEGEEPLAIFKTRVFALGAASPGAMGGMRSLIALRQIMELGLGALVLPEQVAVGNAMQAFDDAGALKDERQAGLMAKTAARLLSTAGRLSLSPGS